MFNKTKLRKGIKKESDFSAKLQTDMSLAECEARLSVIKNEILDLQKSRVSLDHEPSFLEDTQKRDELVAKESYIKADLSIVNSKISVISSYEKEIEKTKNISIDDVQSLYEETKTLTKEVLISFDQLVEFHNSVQSNSLVFVKKELPSLSEEKNRLEAELTQVLEDEKNLSKKVVDSKSFSEIESLSDQISTLSLERGQLEKLSTQIKESKEKEGKLINELDKADLSLYSPDNLQLLKKNIDIFNVFFSRISLKLYRQEYIIKPEKRTYKDTGKPYFYFSTSSENYDEGRDQGETIAFDLAYIEFAESIKMDCPHFLLNDKKELMDDKQLVLIADLVKSGEQVVLPMLSDKLPPALNDPKFFCVTLSNKKKLFCF